MGIYAHIFAQCKLFLPKFTEAETPKTSRQQYGDIMCFKRDPDLSGCKKNHSTGSNFFYEKVTTHTFHYPPPITIQNPRLILKTSLVAPNSFFTLLKDRECDLKRFMNRLLAYWATV